MEAAATILQPALCSLHTVCECVRTWCECLNGVRVPPKSRVSLGKVTGGGGSVRMRVLGHKGRMKHPVLFVGLKVAGWVHYTTHCVYVG